MLSAQQIKVSSGIIGVFKMLLLITGKPMTETRLITSATLVLDGGLRSKDIYGFMYKLYMTYTHDVQLKFTL